MVNLVAGSLQSTNVWKLWSEMTLNYWRMVDRYPNLKVEVDDSIPGCEISSLLDKKNLPGDQLPHVVWH